MPGRDRGRMHRSMFQFTQRLNRVNPEAISVPIMRQPERLVLGTVHP